MADFDDVRLSKSVTVEREAHRAYLRWIIVAVLVIVAAIGGYLLLRRQAKAPAQSSAPAPQVRVAEGTTTAPERGEQIPLPPLDETDPIVRDLVRKLSSHPAVAAWLATNQLIRNFTVVVVNIADGQTPAKHLRALKPAGSFATTSAGSSETISPASYARYDVYADAVDALDGRGAARLYLTLKPRIQDAYRELGYPEGDFDATLKRAIVALLETPVVDGSITVRRSPVSYKFVDPRLESLSGAQKQLLRMGPRNMTIIQRKLREIAGAIGIELS